MEKKNEQRITWLTACVLPFAQMEKEAGIDNYPRWGFHRQDDLRVQINATRHHGFFDP